ncbi:MAG: DivIVA domain-containing protein [Myxococcales bacterium]|nr:DivIVA domain-containing protein [Myxococcales bacterium]
MSITPLDVDQKQFRVVLRGYDANEVNTFLSQVSRELEEVIRENKQLEEELRRRDENLREYRENESRLREALVSAGRMTEEIKESARKEAELIRAEAELHADKIVASSRERVVQLTEQYHVLRRQKARLLAELSGILDAHRRLVETHEELDREASRAEEARVQARRAVDLPGASRRRRTGAAPDATEREESDTTPPG